MPPKPSAETTSWTNTVIAERPPISAAHRYPVGALLLDHEHVADAAVVAAGVADRAAHGRQAVQRVQRGLVAVPGDLPLDRLEARHRHLRLGPSPGREHRWRLPGLVGRHGGEEGPARRVDGAGERRYDRSDIAPGKLLRRGLDFLR